MIEVMLDYVKFEISVKVRVERCNDFYKITKVLQNNEKITPSAISGSLTLPKFPRTVKY